MFDHPSEPEHLIDSLISFVEVWHGLRSWYGVDAEKLAESPVPMPLSRLYATLGNMPGEEDRPFAFWHQDRLLPFEWLETKGDRLQFAVENQGCWRAYTALTGRDPEVWLAFEEDEPEVRHPSLANFLVTLCLQEITLSSDVLYAGDGLIGRLKSCKFRVTPLWMHGLYPSSDKLRKVKVHLIEGKALIFDNHWIGLHSPDDEPQFQQALDGLTKIQPAQRMGIEAFLADPAGFPMAKRIIYERLANEHQAQADLHQSRANECRRLAQSVMEAGGT